MDITCAVLDTENATSTRSTLGEVRGGKPLVLDFWHTRCTRCPEALTKLNALARQDKGVTFVACAMSLGSESEGTQEQVTELLEDQWEHLTHIYMTFDEKEAAKQKWGFKAVPFCVVFGADGTELYTGDPKGVDLKTVRSPVEEVAIISESLASAELSPTAGKPQPDTKEKSPASVVLGFGGDDEDF